MASEIRVNKLNSQTGVGTITLSPTGVDISGITTAETLKATTGIVTTLTATTGIVTTFEATTGDITTLRAPTGIVTSLEATTGDITTLRAPTGIVTTFVTNTAKVGAAVTITESGIEATGVGITCANLNGGQLSHRNKIINGGMKIFQRGTSEQRSGGNDGYYNGIADRWAIRMHSSVAQTGFSQDTTDNPEGFGTNQKSVRSNAGSSNAAKYYVFDTILEGQDLQDFAKGTSDAKEFTLSFYIKTGVSGVYCVEMRDLDNARMVGGTYTVSNSNWNRYVITFPADTTGKFDNDNGGSLWVRFWLAAGSSFTSGTARTTWGSFSGSDIAVGQTAQVGDNVADTWQITGVQLEVGSQATAFEHRSFGEELSLCQRYYYKSMQYGFTPQQAIPSTGQQDTDVDGYLGWVMYTTTSCRSPYFNHPVDMRTEPTVTIYSSARVSSPTDNRLAIYNGVGWLNTASCSANVNAKKVGFNGTVSSALTAAGTYLIGGGFDCDAELQEVFMSYKFYKDPLSGEQKRVIERLTDGAWIPMNDENRDYQEYLDWVAEGNTTQPAD